MYHYLSVDNVSLKMFTGNFRLLLLNCKQLENVMFLFSIFSWVTLLWYVYGDTLVAFIYIYAAVGADAQPFPTLLLPWTVAFQAPLPMQFSRQEYWSWLPFLPPGDLPDSSIKLRSLTSPTLVGGLFTTSHSWDAICVCVYIYIYTHTQISMYVYNVWFKSLKMYCNLCHRLE